MKIPQIVVQVNGVYLVSDMVTQYGSTTFPGNGISVLAFAMLYPEAAIETQWIDGQKRLTIGKEDTNPVEIYINGGTTPLATELFIGGHPIHRPPTKVI